MCLSILTALLVAVLHNIDMVDIVPLVLNQKT